MDLRKKADARLMLPIIFYNEKSKLKSASLLPTINSEFLGISWNAAASA
jgi:hypothetical protein